MKKSTRLYLQGLLKFIVIPFCGIALIALIKIIQKQFGSTSKIFDDLITAFIIYPLYLLIIGCFANGFFTFITAKAQADLEQTVGSETISQEEKDRNNETIELHAIELCNKGIAKEIYKNELFIVLNFRDQAYLFLLYGVTCDKKAIGFIHGAKNTYNFITEPEKFSIGLENLTDEEFANSAVAIDGNTDKIFENEDNLPTDIIDKNLEKKLHLTNIYKIFGYISVIVPIFTFGTGIIHPYIYASLCVFSAVIGMTSVIGSRIQNLKLWKKAVFGIILSIIGIYLSFLG